MWHLQDNYNIKKKNLIMIKIFRDNFAFYCKIM